MAAIHPTAIIDAGAELGAGVSVGPYAVIGAGVVLGAGCRIGPHAVILGPTRMGAGNEVWQFASIGDIPQDKKYGGEQTLLEIGDRNRFRECCTVNRGTVTGAGITRIGSDNLFMAYSHVAHDCVVGNQCVLANCATLAGHVELDDWVVLGGFAGVHQFCKIGAHAFIGMGCLLGSDVPPFVMMANEQRGRPRGINSEGLKRRGFDTTRISAIKRAYRTLYMAGLTLADAREQLTVQANDSDDVRAMLEFLNRSERSLAR